MDADCMRWFLELLWEDIHVFIFIVLVYGALFLSMYWFIQLVGLFA